MMRAGLAGDRQTPLFCLSQQADAAGGTDMLAMHPGAGQLRQQDIARAPDVLGGPGLAQEAELGGLKVPLGLGDIAALLDGGEDGRIGAGAANAKLFEGLDQRSFSEAGWGFSKVLLGEELYKLQPVALFRLARAGSGFLRGACRAFAAHLYRIRCSG